MTTDNEKIILGEIETQDDSVLDAVTQAFKRVASTMTMQPTAGNIRKHVINELGASNKRKAILERLSQLPNKEGEEIRAGLVAGNLQISDKIFYATEAPTGTTTKLIKTEQPTQIGKTNISNSKVDMYALVHGIYLRYSTGTTETNAKFDQPLPAAIVNGELTVKVNTKEVISGLAVEKFASFGVLPSDKPFNYVALENPKWILKDKILEAYIETADSIATGFVKISFDCSVIQPL
jgi:hypothetical protein